MIGAVGADEGRFFVRLDDANYFGALMVTQLGEEEIHSSDGGVDHDPIVLLDGVSFFSQCHCRQPLCQERGALPSAL